MQDSIKIIMYKKIYSMFSYFNHVRHKEIYINPKYLSKTIKEYRAIVFHKVEELLQTKELVLYSIHNLTEQEINNFIFISKEARIELRPSSTELSRVCNDEREYINILSKIFKILEKHNRHYNICIFIQNRELLNQSKILEDCKNINLTIYTDFHNYTKEEYLQEEAQLDELVAPIKNCNLSPYEKFLAIYNIVKQFKQYNDNKSDSQSSRRIRYILNNKYIVCVGYAVLLETLLNKVGIPSISIDTDVDISYDDGFTPECIPTQLRAHRRNIVKIDDDKYNIHGIYIADTTWDNDIKYDFYNNCAITFDRKKEAYRLEKITEIDLLLDFHNFEEFNVKINYLLKRNINKSKEVIYTEKIIDAYLNIYIKIMGILITLDYKKYSELNDKYGRIIGDIRYKRIVSVQEIEKIYSNFLAEYATYIIPLSNQKIKDTILYQAALNVKKIVDRCTNAELKKWNRETKKINQKAHSIRFPYSYNPKEPRRNYLKTRGKIRTKSKK